MAESSNPSDGSSRSTTSGELLRAAGAKPPRIATLLLSPPDRWANLSLALCSRPHRDNSSMIWSSLCSIPATESETEILSMTVSSPQTPPFCRVKPIEGGWFRLPCESLTTIEFPSSAQITSPDRSGISPANASMRVVFPDPFSPIIATTSPWQRVSETPSSTRCVPRCTTNSTTRANAGEDMLVRGRLLILIIPRLRIPL